MLSRVPQATTYKVKEGEGTITFALGDVQGKEGAYTLTAESDKVNITGNSYGGVICRYRIPQTAVSPQIESKKLLKVQTGPYRPLTFKMPPLWMERHHAGRIPPFLHNRWGERITGCHGPFTRWINSTGILPMTKDGVSKSRNILYDGKRAWANSIPMTANAYVSQRLITIGYGNSRRQDTHRRRWHPIWRLLHSGRYQGCHSIRQNTRHRYYSRNWYAGHMLAAVSNYEGVSVLTKPVGEASSPHPVCPGERLCIGVLQECLCRTDSPFPISMYI